MNSPAASARGASGAPAIHQAIEAKEGAQGHRRCRATPPKSPWQELFTRYEHIAGMTGTAVSSAGELREGLQSAGVVAIPTNRPSAREGVAVARSSAPRARSGNTSSRKCGKFTISAGPVLIGTRSIDKSEQLSSLLITAGIPHQVLNAKTARRRGPTSSSRAGRGAGPRDGGPRTWAGRGTDIKLGGRGPS